jgi:uncharacterized protein
MAQHFLIQYVQTGSNDSREEKRGEHIAYRKSLGAALSLSGPLLDDDSRPIGSVIILAGEDRADVERIANADPFVKEGLLTIRSITMMRIAAMKPPAQD